MLLRAPLITHIYRRLIIAAENHDMLAKPPFDARTPTDITALIRDYPLAWLVSGSEENLLATQVPLLADVDQDDRVTALIGHLARRNPHVADLHATVMR
jgi:predicted FMN-binding regulatory protein PaiB